MRDESHGKVSPALSLGDQGAFLLPRLSTRGALENTPWTWFPQGECRLITNRRGRPVQHASLIFHCSDFQPPIASFYRRLKSGKARQAA